MPDNPHPDVCPRCSGTWGADQTCANCTLPSGEARPETFHNPGCAGSPTCAGCSGYDQFGNWIPGPDTGWTS